MKGDLMEAFDVMGYDVQYKSEEEIFHVYAD
jgi:hypothetical protein